MAEPEAKQDAGIGPDVAARLLAALVGDEAAEERDVGARLEGFILGRMLGEGAGGVVYQGFREGSDRALAIKVLHKRMGREDGKRAWRELELLASLRLPALPRVIDYGLSDGRLYIAAEFVDGRPLDRYCDGPPMLDRRARVELLARVADAVQSLHEQGVIHRDLKPSNILVDARGEPVIIDLGIATLLSADVMETLTAEGRPIGSPAFMAPEQARGERERISTRSDVYSLGAIAYLILAGQTPHDMNTTLHEAVRRVGMDPARRAREVEPGLARGLAAVLEQAVEGRPECRYASAAELGSDLRRWLRGESVLAAGAGLWSRVARAVARHPLISTSVAAAALGGCIFGTAVVSWWWLGARPWSVFTDPDPGGPHWVEVRSYAGFPIKRWEAATGSAANAIGPFERAREFGGGKLFLVTGALKGQGQGTDELRAFSARDLTEPLWASGCKPPEVKMPPLEGFSAAEGFRVLSVQAADVFAERPGVEFIAVLCHVGWAPTVVRVYDARGQVLFEAWHNGWVNGVRWLPEVGLMVLVGVNSEVTWFGRGVEDAGSVFPTILAAIRPELGRRAGWITTPSAPGDLEPVWYKCLLPAGAMDALDPQHGVQPMELDSPDPRAAFRLVVGDAILFLSKDGEETKERFTYARHYRSGESEGSRDAVQLGELPPIFPDRAVSARPPNN